MGVEAGIKDLLHGRMGFQKPGHGQSALVLLADAQMQGLDPPQQQVGGHGVQGGAVDFAVVVDRFDPFFLAADDAAQGIGVAAQVFGGAVQHKVGAQFQRILVDGGGKGVVHHDGGADPFSGGGQSGDVHHLYGRVGGAFQVKQAAASGHGCFDGFMVGGVAKGHIDIVAGQRIR